MHRQPTQSLIFGRVLLCAFSLLFIGSSASAGESYRRPRFRRSYSPQTPYERSYSRRYGLGAQRSPYAYGYRSPYGYGYGYWSSYPRYHGYSPYHALRHPWYSGYGYALPQSYYYGSRSPYYDSNPLPHRFQDWQGALP